MSVKKIVTSALVGAAISFALIFIGGFKYITSRSNLVPLNDTELIHSINHRNH